MAYLRGHHGEYRLKHPDKVVDDAPTGTAYKDGYYAGGGAVTFGRPPAGGQIPRVGDRLTVTVVMIPNRTWVRDHHLRPVGLAALATYPNTRTGDGRLSGASPHRTIRTDPQ
jgi:hypothetical protein